MSSFFGFIKTIAAILGLGFVFSFVFFGYIFLVAPIVGHQPNVASVMNWFGVTYLAFSLVLIIRAFSKRFRRLAQMPKKTDGKRHAPPGQAFKRIEQDHFFGMALMITPRVTIRNSNLDDDFSSTLDDDFL